MKIQIIGYAGSGKSTLAKILGNHFGIPYLHLDNTHFYGDWQERTTEEQTKIVDEFLSQNENWVIDGNYTRISPRRFFESDITIFLNYNRFFCYRMCKKRYLEYKGKTRESIPCEEKFDKDFKKWILFDSRTKEKKERHLNNLNKTSGQKLMFKNRKQLNKWLDTILNK